MIFCISELPTRLLLIAAVLSAWAGPAYADKKTSSATTSQPDMQPDASAQTRSETMLDPVLVTARHGNHTNTVVRSERIEVEQATAVRDLFKQTPEVNVSGGPPATQKIYVRGINERMLNVTIDGAAQADAAYHHAGQVMIEPELLKRVEVEAGTGAATAGPGALGGALRFTTKTAEDLLRPGERFGALLKSGYQSGSSGIKLSATGFGRLNDDTSLLASISKLKTGDYRDGNGDQVPHSETSTRDVFLKLNSRLTNAHRFSLSHESYHDEGMRNRRTNLQPRPFNLPDRQRAERTSSIFGYDYNAGNPLVKAKFSAYINDSRFMLALDKPRRENYGSRTKGFALGNISRLAQHKLAYGVDYRQDTSAVSFSSGRLPDEQSSVKGIYLQDSYAVLPTVQLAAAARYDRYDYTDVAHQRYRSNGFSPNAGITWEALENLTLSLSHARALRGVGNTEPFLKQRQTNASSIAPEKARNTELGAQWQHGPWQLAGALYHQHINNFIGYGKQRGNLGDVRVRGYSSSVGYRTGHWSSSLGMSLSRPELNGRPLGNNTSMLLGNSTGRTWVAQLDYAMPQYNLKTGWTGRLVERLNRVPAKAPGKSGYGIHDVYAEWLPTGKDIMTITLAVKNLFGRQYLDQSSFGYSAQWKGIAGLPEPGRDVRLTLAWRI